MRPSVYVIVRREDFTAEAIDLGIWDSLVEKLPKPTTSVRIAAVERDG